MISISANTKFYLASTPVDMRKSLNGLSIIVADEFKLDPQSGHFFIFYNRSRNKIKCLAWDKNGFVLYYKRLEKCSFKIPRSINGYSILLTQNELRWLLAGLDFMAIKQHPEFTANSLFW